MKMKSGSKNWVETVTIKPAKEIMCRFVVGKLKERNTSEYLGNDAKKTLGIISYSN
jgi:hypothetical protein